MEETLDILSTPGALEEIRQGLAEVEAGNYVDADELLRRYARRDEQ